MTMWQQSQCLVGFGRTLDLARAFDAAVLVQTDTKLQAAH